MATATITVTGNIGRQAVVKETATGKKITSFPMASTPRVKQNNEWVDGETMWFTVSLWGAYPEIIFDKGVRVMATGQLVKKTYKADDGTDRESLFINADTVAVVPSKIAETTPSAEAEIPANWEPISTPVQTSLDVPF